MNGTSYWFRSKLPFLESVARRDQFKIALQRAPHPVGLKGSRSLVRWGGWQCGLGWRNTGSAPLLRAGGYPPCPRRVCATPSLQTRGEGLHGFTTAEGRQGRLVCHYSVSREPSEFIDGGNPIWSGEPRRDGTSRRADFRIAGGGVGRACPDKSFGKGPGRTPTDQSCHDGLALRFGSFQTSKPETARGVSILQRPFN